ncbi:helix-turn-helix transcriptional regulator [Halalkalibacter flavus]|uniref:helix-turn-helix transcriptional regulator n=1 Tax=Halalkalibacter flavus TaxID=3090668 RepID=UPI002FCBEDD1
MFGIGRRGSKFGHFLQKHRITQTEIAKEAKVSDTTISRLSKGNAFKPSIKNGMKIIKALKKYDKNVDFEDFWGA